jgi:cytochrome c oxidase subunit IV
MSANVVPIKTYLSIFTMLMALLAATMWVAYVDLGDWNLPVAMAIAMIKGALIVLFFMHVHYGSGLAKVFAGAGFFWLFILLSIAMSDYATRHWPFR